MKVLAQHPSEYDVTFPVCLCQPDSVLLVNKYTGFLLRTLLVYDTVWLNTVSRATRKTPGFHLRTLLVYDTILLQPSQYC
jgi:hypothetical protein